MKKYTTEEVWMMWKKDPISIYQEVVSGRIYTNDIYSEVDIHTKRSLSRKAFRYVSEQSTKGTIPATITAYRLGFHLMESGFVKPIKTSDWDDSQTFTDSKGNLITVESTGNEITFKSIHGSKTVARPEGLHHDYIHTCVDIPQMYEDPRYDWKIKVK